MTALFVVLLVCFPAAFGVVETGPPASDLDSPDIPEAIDVLPALLAEAESTIDIAQMYMLYYPSWSRGALLYRLYDGIAAAGARGVRVRVLLDAVAIEANPSLTYTRIPAMLKDLPNVEVRLCDLRPYSSCPSCMMHAKYLVIDNRAAFLGSHNWSYGAMADNRELSIEVRDVPVARALTAVFSQDWEVAGGTQQVLAEPDGDGRLAVTGPAALKYRQFTIWGALVQLLAEARTRLDLEFNSFSTRVDFGGEVRFGMVDSMLRQAAGRGVCVRLLVDRWAFEHEPTLFLSLDSRPGVNVRIADIRPAGPNPHAGTVHSKLAIADGQVALVGSATLSQRQLLECRNVAVRLDEAEVVARLAGFFESGWQSSLVKPVTEVSRLDGP